MSWFAESKEAWFGNVKGDVLAGIVVALALIPEAIAFSIIAGVSPMVGLYSSFIIPVLIAFIGGRPGMISAATGAMALLMVQLVADHGIEYLFAATLLTGFFQILFGVFRLARYMKFIPRSVMVGFVNALAILIFLAQVEQLEGGNFLMFALVACTLAIIYLFPYLTKSVPSTLVAIVAITAITLLLGLETKTVGDMGNIFRALPVFGFPVVPLHPETFMIIAPTALALALVGLLESLLTATIVDDLTDTDSDKNRESRGQGIANIVTGLFGGMAGCAMIGQSVINVKSGGRGRLSALVAGAVLMFMIVVLGDIVVRIPMAALIGIMIMVSISTFDWSSVKHLNLLPRTDAVVMIITVGVVVFTHNLAIGVFTGMILSAIFFVSKISKIEVDSKLQGGKRVYFVKGELFFASVTELLTKFHYKEDVAEVELNFKEARLWDDSAVAAVDKLVYKFEDAGIKTVVTGLNEKSQEIVERLGNKLGSH
ncbi:SulP family inorganic anion transporter [Paenibacillus sp. TRM 82003]|nr:SulP family inorganic anion transporter [Paenibacillus sp. TRM 82003]